MTLLRTILTATTGIAMMAFATQANAYESASQNDALSATTNMAVYEDTLPPFGFVQFCKYIPEDCGGTMGEAVRVVMNADRWNDLRLVNDAANQAIEPVSDMDLYKVVEHWTYPQSQGDCEDYVLLKRKKLMMMGWPAEALLITVVRNKQKEGHAVLTIATDKGDFVLDNLTTEILQWQNTGLTYYKRQSQSDPRQWVSLKPGRLTAKSDSVANIPAR